MKEWIVPLAALGSFGVTLALCVITAVYVVHTKRIAVATRKAAESTRDYAESARDYAESARDSLEALVLQGLTDTAIAGIRDMLRNPDLARQNYVGWANMPTGRIQGFMLADIWFLHWENVLAQKHHLPNEIADLYDRAMGQIFRNVPVLHDWLNMSRDMWSDQLKEVAERNQPVSAAPSGS